jgi:hypothetical protein
MRLGFGAAESTMSGNNLLNYCYEERSPWSKPAKACHGRSLFALAAHLRRAHYSTTIRSAPDATQNPITLPQNALDLTRRQLQPRLSPQLRHL